MVVSDFKRPASEFWKEDSLVITNTDDLMAEIAHFTRDVVSNFKVCECLCVCTFILSYRCTKGFALLLYNMST